MTELARQHTYIPGFDPFLELPDMLTPIVNKYINKVLGKLTKMLSDETAIALSTNLGESKGKSMAFSDLNPGRPPFLSHQPT